jgi:N6-adenosine-specific RNA methylase IME4
VFSIFYLDPPWLFSTWSQRGKGRSPERHYPCMPIADIKAINLQPLMNEACAFFIWGTWPMLPHIIDLGKAWKLHYSTCAFVWVKQRRNIAADPVKVANVTDPSLWHIGTGYNTRANTEFCLLFTTKKKLKRRSKSVRQLVIAPVEQHSKKPIEIYSRIEELYGNDLPRLEVFARQTQPGWTATGNGVDGLDINESLRLLALPKTVLTPQNSGVDLPVEP